MDSGPSVMLIALGALMMVSSSSLASPCDIDQLKAEVLTISQTEFKVA